MEQMVGVTLVNIYKQDSYFWGINKFSILFMVLTGLSLITFTILLSCAYSNYLRNNHTLIQSKYDYTWGIYTCIILFIMFSFTAVIVSYFANKQSNTIYEVLLDNTCYISEIKAKYKIIEDKAFTYLLQAR